MFKDAVRQSKPAVGLASGRFGALGGFRRKAIGRFGWFPVRSIEDGQAVRFVYSKLVGIAWKLIE